LVAGFLESATNPAKKIPKAIIAPHAGYVYSGAIAGSSFVSLAGRGQAIKRVVLVGPSHRVAFDGIALSEAAEFETPLGRVPVDRQALLAIAQLPYAHFFEPAHANEHSLEVELPFLQHLLNSFEIIPLVVGEATDEQVQEVMERLWGGPETLMVVSSDLSHYHNYTLAQKMDSATARAVEELSPGEINPEHACGWLPIRGLLGRARDCELVAQTVDLRNSGDTAGTRDRVVGYGAFVFTES
jgi:AmmeMemoRadiSam system protein B